MTNEQITQHGTWIWIGSKDTTPDSFGAFRRKFTLQDMPEHLYLALSADSQFSLYINGKVQVGNQFSDYPESKTYTVFDIAPSVRKGDNLIAVLVHYLGDDFLRDRKGYPGLWAVLYDDKKVLDETSCSWLSCRAPGFLSGNQIKFTIQLGFSTVFDAREKGADNWMEPDFDDSSWLPSADVAADYSRTLTERPLPCLVDCGFKPVPLYQQGYLRREGEYATPSEQMFSDYLRETLLTETLAEDHLPLYTKKFEVFSTLNPCILHEDGSGLPFIFKKFPDPVANGYYIIADLGQETTGFIGFKVKCSEGTVIDYALGEHLDSGRVRTYIGIRNLSDRYICKEGENTFQLRLRRCAGRYLELHFTETAYPPQILFAGVAEQLYPVENETPFDCPDPLRLKTHAVAVSTLKNCMHEHYEDCPWREQALYSYDSRNQALYGYYLWGNYRFAEVSFDLIGKAMREDGFLELTSPGKLYLTIPNFSFAWISEVYEHCFFSGKTDLFERNAPVVRQLLDFVLSKSTASGLYTPGKGKGIWNFAEWVNGLASGEAEEQATYNLYLYEALKKADELFRLCGIEAPDYAAAADKLGRIIEEKFYLPEIQAYASVTGENAGELLHEHTQALMLFNKLVPAEKIPALLEGIKAKKFIPCTFSSMPFLVRALMEFGPEIQTYTAARISDAFDSLTLVGATTLWENPPSDSIGGDAASLCHGWSSLPVYFNKRYILGVKPLEPGFKRFTVSPFCGNLSRASGEVPTPFGNIRVNWKKTDNGLVIDVTAPEGTTYVKQA